MHRIMRWFDAAGLDLANATAGQCIEFVRKFRERSAEESATPPTQVQDAEPEGSAPAKDAEPANKGSAIA